MESVTLLSLFFLNLRGGDKMKEGTVERYYNQKTMTLTVLGVGTLAYLTGKSKGAQKAYFEGVKDGIQQGIAEGRLEGYVGALSDIASVMRKVTD